jgi:hypothetical protein
LEPLAFDEYCRFDTFAFFWYLESQPRFIYQKKAQVSKRQYSSKAKGFNVRDFLPIIGTVLVQLHSTLLRSGQCVRNR